MPTYDFTDATGNYTLDSPDELTADQVYDHFVKAGIASPRKPQAETPFWRTGDVLSALGDVATNVLPSTWAGVRRGWEGIQKEHSPEYMEAMAADEARNRAVLDENARREAAGELSTVGKNIREIVPSLGFTGASIPSTMAGARTGAFTGGRAATMAGAPELAPQAALVGGVVGGFAGGFGASYRMMGAQFMDDAMSHFNELSMQKLNRPLNDVERQKIYDDLLPVAQNTALWEAAPEAIGNLATLGAGKVILGIGKPAFQALVKSAKAKVLAGVGSQATELATEGITEYGQGNDQAKLEAYKAGLPMESAAPKYQGAQGLFEATKEVAPAVATLGALTAGAGGLAYGANKALRKAPTELSQAQVEALAAHSLASAQAEMNEAKSSDEGWMAKNNAIAKAAYKLQNAKKAAEYVAKGQFDEAATMFGGKLTAPNTIIQDQLNASMAGVAANADVAPQTAAVDQQAQNEPIIPTPAGSPVPGATETEEIPGIGAINRANVAGVPPAEPFAANEPPPSEGVAGDAGEVSSSKSAQARNMETFPDQSDFGGKFNEELIFDPSSYEEHDGIGTATYVNLRTGLPDAYISAFGGDNDFIAYMRVYENGKPTNRFTSKLERRTNRPGATRQMVESLQRRLPEGHEYSEDVSVSTDGLKFIRSQLGKGYELALDERGKPITSEVAISGESLVNDLPIAVDPNGKFENISVSSPKDFAKVRDHLLTLLQPFNAGLTEKNIRWENGTVFVDLPVLRKKSSRAKSKVPPPPPPIITRNTPLTTLQNELQLRINSANRNDFGADGNAKLAADIQVLKAAIAAAQKSSQTITGSNVRTGTEMPVPGKSTATSPGEAPISPQPQTTQTNAPNQRNQPEIVRQEPENGTQGGTTTETSARHRVQREATGAEVQKEVITPQGKPTTATEGKVMPGGSAVERDATKPAQMTPEEFEKVKNSLNSKRAIAQSKLAEAKAIQPSKNPAVQIKQIAKLSARKQELDDAERAFEEFYPTMAFAVEDAIKNRQPFSTAAHKEIGMDYIPSGYVKQGDLYVFQPETAESPTATRAEKTATLKISELKTIPEDWKQAQADKEANNERWQKAIQSKEPIRVIPYKGGYRVSDGHHRLLNAKSKGETSIEAIVEPPLAEKGLLHGITGEVTEKITKHAEKLADSLQEGDVVETSDGTDTARYKVVVEDNTRSLRQIDQNDDVMKLKGRKYLANPVRQGQFGQLKANPNSKDALQIIARGRIIRAGTEVKPKREVGETDSSGAPKLNPNAPDLEKQLISRARHMALGMTWDVQKGQNGDWTHPSGKDALELNAVNPPSRDQVNAIFNDLVNEYGRPDLERKTASNKNQRKVGQNKEKTPPVTISPQVKRDSTKVEQMTPEEIVKHVAFHQSIEYNKKLVPLERVLMEIQEEVERKKIPGIKIGRESIDVSGNKNHPLAIKAMDVANKISHLNITSPQGGQFIGKRGWSDVSTQSYHIGILKEAIQDHLPVSAKAVDDYKITLPKGYELNKVKDLYVFNPQITSQTTSSQAAQSHTFFEDVILDKATKLLIKAFPVPNEDVTQYARRDTRTNKYIAEVEKAQKKPLQNAASIFSKELGRQISEKDAMRIAMVISAWQLNHPQDVLDYTPPHTLKRAWEALQEASQISPQTTAAEKQTAASSAKEAAAAGVVQSETGKGSILPDDETKETPYKEQSRVNFTGSNPQKAGQIIEYLDQLAKGGRATAYSAEEEKDVTVITPGATKAEIEKRLNEITKGDDALVKEIASQLGVKPTVKAIAEDIHNEAAKARNNLLQTYQEAIQGSPLEAGDKVSWFDEKDRQLYGVIKKITNGIATIARGEKAQEKGLLEVPVGILKLDTQDAVASRRKSLDSIIGKPQEVEMNAVSVGDGRESLAMVHNSGDVPGVLNAFVGTSKDFLANPENEKNFPGLYRLLKGGQVDEGNFAYGRAFVFTDGIGINAVDRSNATKLGVTPAVAAVRRVLIHESLVHRGIFGLPAHLQRRILQWVQQNTTPEQLDVLAKTYPQYADWRSNENQLLALCEEFLAKKVEKLTTISKTGPLARLMDILSDIWRWITGNTGEPTIKNLKDVVKLLKAGAEAADARLVNGGKIKMSQLRSQGFVTPEMDAEYLAAVEAGDMEKAQRMVDEAAKAAGFNVGPVYHETRGDFNEFIVSPRGAIFFAFSPERAKAGAKAGAADGFGRGIGRTIRAFVRAKSIEGVSLSDREKETFYKLPQKILTMDDLRDLKKQYPQDSDWIRGAYDSGGNKLPEPPVSSLAQVVKTGRGLIWGKSIPDFSGIEDEAARHQRLREEGYDAGLIADEAGISLVVLNPSQIKSADPVTRDDSGNVIPLSQRFNAASPDIRASYIGEGAIKNFPEERRQFMRDSLDAAKAMAVAGKSSEEIRAVTGWFPGKYDGKLRFEISDNQAAYREKIGAYTKVKNWLYGKLSDETMEGTMVGIPLRQILDFPELYEAYPQIKKIKVDLEERSGAAFLPESNTIALSLDDTPAKRLSYLLHELQHWIQTHEGFAKGASPKGFGFISKQAFDEYQRTAGEIEARDVQARQKFTPEQRKAVAPYSSENIAPEDAIVLFGNQGVQESRPTYANPIDAQLANAAERMRAMREREAAPPVSKALARLFDTNAQQTGTANKLFQTAKAPESGRLGDIETMSPENVDWSLTQLDGRMRQDALGASYEHYKNANVADQWYRYLANKVLSEDALMELNSMYAEMNPNAQFVERDLPRAAFKTGDISELTPEQTSWILVNTDGEDRQRLLGVTRKHYSDSTTADQWANYLAGKIANDPEAMAELSAMHQEMNPNAREEKVTPLDNIKRIVSESVSRSEVESLLKDLNAEEIKEVVRSIGYPTQGTKADNIRRILSFVGARADAIAIRGINPINLNAPTIVRTPEQQAAFDEELRLAKERANELDINLPQKKPLYDQEKWNRNMAAIMAPSSVAPQKIRNEIRAAYDRAIVGESSIQVPIQKVFDEAKSAIPSLTERDFGKQLQNLYEDGSAFLVPTDRSADMIAAGEKWGVYDAAGMPASYVGLMPVEIKASRIGDDVINRQKTDLQKQRITGEQVAYQGYPLTNSQGDPIAITRTQQAYKPRAELARQFVKEVADSLDDITQLPNEVINDSYLRAIGAEYMGDFQTLMLAEAENLLRERAKAETIPEEKQRLNQAVEQAAAFFRQGATQGGLDLNTIKQVQKDPRFAGMFALDTVKTQKKEDQSAVVEPNFNGGYAEGMGALNDEASTEAINDLEKELQDRLDQSWLEKAEATLPEKARLLLAKVRGWLADKAKLLQKIALARSALFLKQSKTKQSVAANAAANPFDSMTVAQVEAEIARMEKEVIKLDKKIGDALESIGDELFDSGDVDSKTSGKEKAERMARTPRKETLLKPGKMTALQRLLDKTRDGWSWKQIFTMPKAGQERRRADMLKKVQENEAFKDLKDDEKAQLVELLDQAWIDRKATYLGQKLKADKTVRLPWVTNKGAAKKLESATPELLKAFNDGTFNKDTFNTILAKKYGVKPIDEKAMERAEQLAEELQDPDLPEPVYARKADELLKLIADTQQLNWAKMLNDAWVASVLAGPRTFFDIGFAVLNGLQRILVESTGLALHGDFKTPAQALSRFISILPQGFKEAAYFIKTGDVSILSNSKHQFARFLSKGLKGGGNHSSTSYQLANWNQDKSPDATPAQKLKGNILRTIGRFMQVVERTLSSLDHINSTATKYGYLPISIAQNKKKYADARLPNAQEMAQFRNQAKAYLLEGREPANFGEQTALDAWTRHFSDRYYAHAQDIVEGASYAAGVSSGTVDPEGVVGAIYDNILAMASKATSAADELKLKAKALLKDPEVFRSDAYTKYALATLGQLVAYSARNLLGFRFIRFGANKLNDSLSYIPGIGLFRLAEKENDNATKSQMIWNNQAFGILLMMAGIYAIHAMEDEEDPEKRGFDLQGSWDGLSAEQKKQLSDSGKKEYTATFYPNGKPITLAYKTWPISAMLSAIGTMTDMVKFKREKWDQKQFTDRLVAATAIAATSTLDSAALSQFADLVGKSAYQSDPDEAFVKRITRVGTNFAGGFVPRVFKDLDYWLLDDKARKYETVWENLGKEVPIYRQHIGGEKLNIFAEPIRTSRSPWSRAVIESPSDEAYRKLGLLNARDIWLTPASPEMRTIGTKNRRRHLTPEEQNRYIKLVGAGYKKIIEQYGDRAISMPKERAKAFIADKTRDVRDRAEKLATRPQ